MRHAKNNFDSIRLLAAIAVIVSHANPLASGIESPLLGNSMGNIAVKIFFVMSGYLICTSWTTDPNTARYLSKRLLRIIPALVVVVFVTVFFVGPLLTFTPLGLYFKSSATYTYLYNCFLYPVYNLPGLFKNNHYPGAVNGSLWSLPVEFAMYLILPCIVTAGTVSRSRWVVPIFTVALCAFSLWCIRIHPLEKHVVFYGTDWIFGLDAAPYFMLGAVFSYSKLERFLDPIFALFLLVFLSLIHPESSVLSELTLFVVLPYVVLSLATGAQRWLKHVGRYGDISYGVYIYGFLVQQCVVSISENRLSPAGNALVSIPIVIILAFASWHVVEKPMLAYKPRQMRARITGRVDGKRNNPEES